MRCVRESSVLDSLLSVSLSQCVTSLRARDVRILVSVSAHSAPDILGPNRTRPNFYASTFSVCNLYFVWRKISSWRPTPQTLCPTGVHLPLSPPPLVRRWKLKNPLSLAAVPIPWSNRLELEAMERSVYFFIRESSLILKLWYLYVVLFHKNSFRFFLPFFTSHPDLVSRINWRLLIRSISHNFHPFPH